MPAAVGHSGRRNYARLLAVGVELNVSERPPDKVLGLCAFSIVRLCELSPQ